MITITITFSQNKNDYNYKLLSKLATFARLLLNQLFKIFRYIEDMTTNREGNNKITVLYACI